MYLNGNIFIKLMKTNKPNDLERKKSQNCNNNNRVKFCVDDVKKRGEKKWKCDWR